MRLFVVIGLLIVSAVGVVSQQLSRQSRALEVAAAFTKKKHEVKEKHGVRVEKYKHVQSEPDIRQNIRDYSGAYHVPELGFVINVQVGTDGTVQANGYVKGEPSRSFILENARIEGAVLTASRVYRDGTAEKFEGVFLKRTDRISPTDRGITNFGMGVILDHPTEFRSGFTYDKLFYQLSP